MLLDHRMAERLHRTGHLADLVPPFEAIDDPVRAPLGDVGDGLGKAVQRTEHPAGDEQGEQADGDRHQAGNQPEAGLQGFDRRQEFRFRHPDIENADRRAVLVLDRIIGGEERCAEDFGLAAIGRAVLQDRIIDGALAPAWCRWRGCRPAS